MKRKAALLTALLLSVGLAGCGTEKDSSMEAPELLEPVDVKMDIATARTGDIYQLSAYNGEVVPYTEGLSFTVDGYLEAINVMMGDMVQEGDVLAVLSEEHIAEQIESLEDEIDDLVTMGEFSDRQAAADIEIAREELEMLPEPSDIRAESRSWRFVSWNWSWRRQGSCGAWNCRKSRRPCGRFRIKWGKMRLRPLSAEESSMSAMGKKGMRCLAIPL